MTWSTVHDEMLCREILVVDPFTGTKKGGIYINENFAVIFIYR